MKIELARNSGFCMGVRDAVLSLVKELNTTGEHILVYGPLIHNPQTMSVLNARGLKTINDLESIDGKTVAIRTHGVPIETLREIRKRAGRVCNMTCPRVAHVQGIIKKYALKGFFTIIIGDEGHAEVNGLKSYAAAGCIVISRAAQIAEIPAADRYLVVAQTTQDRQIFSVIASEITKRFKDVTVFNTICDSTDSRQGDIRRAIDDNIDTLVVVGGRNSANTQRLAQMGRECSIRTFHIETPDELEENDLQGAGNILVTAGASTPSYIINNVLEKLYDIKFKNSSTFARLATRAFDALQKTIILPAVSSFVMALFIQWLAGNTVMLIPAVISMLYIFSMYVINNRMDMKYLMSINPMKYSVQDRHHKLFTVLSALSLTASLTLSLALPVPVFLLYAASCAMGILYSTPIAKRTIHTLLPLPAARLYNQKNLAVSFGWVIAVTCIPLMSINASPFSCLKASVFVFTVIFIRSMLYDKIAFQSDVIFGRESLLTILGSTATDYLVYSIATIGAVGFGLMAMLSGSPAQLVFLLNILYPAALYAFAGSKNYIITRIFEYLIDGNFILFMLLFLLML
jgi:(E)-4-hydroxy-3-methyl-but-2-enyl pyrophosphate reductase